MTIFKKIKNQIFIKRDLKRRMTIINNQKIDILFDIGANTGQYSSKLRNLGYKNGIISFEPLTKVFEILEKTARKDGNWIVNNYALGDEDGEGIINISGHSDNSSIQDMTSNYLESAPVLKYVGKQKIEIKKLDSIFNSYVKHENKVMIKIDTQGYEKNVLDGAIESLSRISIIQLEMSIVQLYKDEMLFMNMINYIESKGFQLYSLENGSYNRNSGQLLQVDGIFVNKKFIR
jgi:FkbM family methyltransferase